jgi:hypothetical protein
LEEPTCSIEEQNGSKVHTLMLMMAIMMIIDGDLHLTCALYWTVFPNRILSKMWNTRICPQHSAIMFRLTNLGVKINTQDVLLVERNMDRRRGK